MHERGETSPIKAEVLSWRNRPPNAYVRLLLDSGSIHLCVWPLESCVGSLKHLQIAERLDHQPEMTDVMTKKWWTLPVFKQSAYSRLPDDPHIQEDSPRAFSPTEMQMSSTHSSWLWPFIGPTGAKHQAGREWTFVESQTYLPLGSLAKDQVSDL